MKFLVKLLFGFFIFVCIFLCVIYLFLIIAGKGYFINKLEEATKRKVTIGRLDVTPLLKLHIKKLEIEGLVRIERITIAPSLVRLLVATTAFNDIRVINPELIIEKPLEKKEPLPGVVSVQQPPLTGETQAEAEVETAQVKKHLPFLIFKNILVKGGRINFIDPNAGKSGIKIEIKDIDFNLTNLYLMPVSAIANFKLSGKIPWGKEGAEEGRINFEGWANLRKKNIEAVLRVEKIDGVYLYPYYSAWVDLEKARIEKANLNFNSDIVGINNKVTAQCHLELTDIVRKPKPEEQPEEQAAKITDVILDMFKSMDQGKIVLDFTIKTKMDKPEFGLSDVISAVEDKFAQAQTSEVSAKGLAMLPGKLLEGTAKGATDFFKALIFGTIDAGKQVFKTVGESFKKPKPKAPAEVKK